MKLPDEFERYINKNIARKTKPDKQKAEFLINESETSLRGVKKRLDLMGIDDDNVNSIVKDCYDIIMELVRAKLLLDGYVASGNYAHESEISYLRKLNFLDSEILFLNELRYSRNSITYYGKILDKEYAEKVVEFLNDIYPKLKRAIGQK